MLCSKFSPMCLRTLESVKQLQISLESHFKIIWIDHPSIRQKLSQGDITTVPTILTYKDTHYEKLEGQDFVNYMNSFIQKHVSMSNIPPQPQEQQMSQQMAQHQQLLAQQQAQQQMAQQQAQQQLMAQQQAQQQLMAQQQAQLQAQQQAQQQAMLQQQHAQQQAVLQQQVNQEASQLQHAQHQAQAHQHMPPPQHMNIQQSQQAQAQLQMNQQALQQAQGHLKVQNLPENGTTSLLSILGDKSLFDFQEDERQLGTDSRMSDHSESSLQGSKRNSINQKVRSMSTDRVGHIKPMSSLEEIDADDTPFIEPSVTLGKKKMSISDMAKELAKGRD